MSEGKNKKMNVKQISERLNKENVKKGFEYIRRNGVSRFWTLAKAKAFPAGKSYKEWYEEHCPTKEELMRQREVEFSVQPLISIVVPTYQTPIPFLKDMIDSVRKQSYEKWELCIADGSLNGDENDTKVIRVREELNRYSMEDKRIKVVYLEENQGIAENTNQALALATGEYIGLFDHDDMLTPDALYEIVKAINDYDYDVLYTDEDKISENSHDYKKPVFKPDYSPELLCANNYITHFFVAKKSIVDRLEGFRKEYDGSQDYDFIFRCVELAKKVGHVSKVLYHWRMHGGSVAGDPTSKMYAYDAGKKAIQSHYERVGIQANVEHMERLGLYHTEYKMIKQPLISVIIYGEDDEKKKRCSEWFKRKDYSNLEILASAGISVEEINALAEKARGSYLFFVSENLESVERDALQQMAGVLQIQNVGAVSGKVIGRKHTVEDVGVVFRTNGDLCKANYGIGDCDYGDMFRAKVMSNYSILSLNCFMTHKNTFEELGRFNKHFSLSFAAADYCLKLRMHGKRCVMQASVVWESKGSMKTGIINDEERERFYKEWQEVLRMGDSYYNSNYAKQGALYILE
ncbi:glycosyltransferase [Dorea formicigenerans]|uniref:glycosyltransferase family 2 protein n=2 Tax=Dorea formicigenerans TaxID=39486 RepID=UPI00156EA17A|nr:glycosyltransferase [Dorea formicigenerans]MCB6380377.1 glycosyltransferase [Dorea formicigenerans]MCB6408652.1 glycosyltransferase [Dorea formicigenerans]MCB6466563.1 glycosyltransferase [Dorea formicigenerans]MCB7199623.1 glycosyltransferase [Dorea formicigenerans]MCB7229744.1 glycosyltransferase [Dorea formicigenerans]